MEGVSPRLPGPALRSALAVLGSIVVGAGVMFAVQAANFALFPPPAGLDYDDPEQLRQIVDAMPPAALWMLESSYVLGCVAAGVVLAASTRGRTRGRAVVVGGIFTLLGVVNLTQFPAPLWLAVLSTLTYLPATLLGAWSAARWRSVRRRGAVA